MIHLFYDTSILRYKLSTQIAPKGAVIKIDKTATVNTVCPHASPIASGTAPMAACTVAFGVYASMQNIFSLLVSSEPSRQSHTPAMRNSKAPQSSITAKTPAEYTYWRSTVAPTSTNRIISAATHSLLYLVDNLAAKI